MTDAVCYGCEEEKQGRTVNPSQHTHSATEITPSLQETPPNGEKIERHGGHKASPLKLAEATREHLQSLATERPNYDVFGMLRLMCSCETVIEAVCGCNTYPYLCAQHAWEFVKVHDF